MSKGTEKPIMSGVILMKIPLKPIAMQSPSEFAILAIALALVL